MVLRQVEWVEIGSIAIGSSHKASIAFGGKLYQMVGVRTEISVFVANTHTHKVQIIFRQRLFCQFDMMRISSRLAHCAAKIGYDFQFAWRVCHIVPNQAVAAL